MKHALKRLVATRWPSAVAAYHTFRLSRETFRHPSRSTPFGFRMKGHASMQTGTFEQDETAILRELFPRIDTFVDVGANVGFFTCLARHTGLHVIAVEPSAANLELLLANIAANGWTDVEVYPLALSRQPGLAPLYGDGTGASMVRRWSGTSEVWQRLVPVTTLDLLLAARFKGRRLLIKIDVEGLEHEVLEGAAQTLALDPAPVWLLEVCLTEHHPGGMHPHFRDVFHAFWRYGYQARTADAERRLVTPADVARWAESGRRDFGWINFLFDKADAGRDASA